MKKTFNLFDLSQKVNYRTEILAGLTVAMTMIPESLSFAILAGFPPLAGLYAAFIAGLITAIFGGRPGMISGGAGATVIVLIALMKSHGLDYVFAAVALAGVLQIIVGVFRLGKFIRLVPHPVMFGFVNGLAIIIFMSVELMLNAANLLLAAFSSYKADPTGQVFVFFIMVVAAAEVSVGLAIIVMMYRNVHSVDINFLNRLKN